MGSTLTVVFTGVIAVATVVYAILTKRLWEETKNAANAAKASADAAKESADAAMASVAQMRDTAEKQLRAYVCVDSAVLKFPQPDIPEAQVHFENCGQTPAYDVRGWIHTWFTEYPLKETLPAAPESLSKGTEPLAPGRRTIFVTPKKPPLPPEYVASLGTEKFTLYVYGEIRYRDIFGRQQYTKYRMIHGGGEGTRKIVGKDGSEEWLLKPDSEGNDAT